MWDSSAKPDRSFGTGASAMFTCGQGGRYVYLPGKDAIHTVDPYFKSSTLRYIELRSEAQQLDEALDLHQSKHAEKMSVLKKRGEGHKRKTHEFRKSIKKLDKYITANIAKKEAYLKIAAQRRVEAMKAKENILELRWQMVKLRMKRNMTLELFRWTENILKYFTGDISLMGLANYHFTLVQVLRELEADKDRTEAEFWKLWSELGQVMRELEMKHAAANEDVYAKSAILQRKYYDTEDIQAKLAEILDCANHFSMTMGHIRMLVRDLYLKCKEHVEPDDAMKENFEEQLQCIRTYIESHFQISTKIVEEMSLGSGSHMKVKSRKRVATSMKTKSRQRVATSRR